MSTTNEWVELFTVERSPDGFGDRQAMAVQLAVHGIDMDGVDPKDVRVDLLCGRDADLRSRLRVSVRRAVYDEIGTVVLTLPLEDLAQPGQTQSLGRTRSLGVDDIAELLRSAQVQFVIADVGHPLVWVDRSRTFDVWKAEVRPHVADPDSPAHLDDFPGGFLYFASEWTRTDGGSGTVVVLEKQH